MVSDRNAQIPGTPVKPLSDPMIIGRIARPVGVRGEVKVSDFEGCPACLLGTGEIIVNLNGDFRALEITHYNPSGKWIRYKLKGVESPEEAALLKGAEIVIPWEDRPPKAENDYYVDDLVGCMVVTDDEIELGIMEEVWRQGHHDIWVARGFKGEVLIPAVKEYILDVDLGQHRITVRHIEGLWDES